MFKRIQASGFPIILTVFFLLISVAGYMGLAWWVKTNDPFDLSLSLLAVVSGYAFWWFNRTILSWSTILTVAIFFRLLFLFDDSTRLSNDSYRFLWDAEQVAEGQNPYLYTPNEWSEMNPNGIFAKDGELFKYIEAPNEHSVYPPVCQFFWSLSPWLAKTLGFDQQIGARIILLKVIYFVLEIVTMLLLMNVLIKRGLAGQLAGIYALNPLVILEFTGNLHPEAIMILFLILAALLALSNRVLLAGIPFGFAISTKFIPILFIPFLIKKYGWKNALLFGVVGIQVAALVFIPFVSDQLIPHVLDSLGRYFTTSEFNASLFFLLRNMTEDVSGYNYILLIGPLLLLAAFFALFIVLMKQKSTINAMIVVYFIYIITATSVQPWYLTLPLLLAVFGTHRWPLIASCAVLLSYFLYSFGMENWWILGTEYLIIITAFIVDLFRPRQKQPKLNPNW